MKRLIALTPAAMLSLVIYCALTADAGRLAAQPPDFGEEFDFEQEFGQGDEPSPGEMVGMMVAWFIGFVVGMAFQILICYLLYTLLQVVPSAHRKMEPGMVWLLLIPCFNFVWNFFVYQRISASYQSYFNSIGRSDVGDCGGQLGLWFAICVVGTVIPCVGAVAGLAALVLLVLWMVKLFGLKKEIQAKPGFAGM